MLEVVTQMTKQQKTGFREHNIKGENEDIQSELIATKKSYIQIIWISQRYELL